LQSSDLQSIMTMQNSNMDGNNRQVRKGIIFEKECHMQNQLSSSPWCSMGMMVLVVASHIEQPSAWQQEQGIGKKEKQQS